jgi:Flp pilus assembly pilin Flp
VVEDDTPEAHLRRVAATLQMIRFSNTDSTHLLVRRVGMLGATSRLLREEQAQDLIEYALLSSLLAVACITGILELTEILNFFAAIGAALNAAI